MTPLDARVSRAIRLAAPMLALGLAASAWVYVMGRIEGRPVDVVGALGSMMPFWLVWSSYTPVVVWLTRRRPIERGHLFARSAMHLGIAVAMGVGNTGIRFALRSVLHVADGSPASSAPLLSLATLELPVHVFLYAAVLAVAHIGLYYDHLRERELAATRLQAQLADARMRALRMQLHPHFLFNALNSVAMLAREGKRDAAVETLERLGDLLRHVLEDAAGQEVTLRRELEFVERYLAIEGTRFQDRLQVAVDAPEDTLDAMVLNLVLQPLVENAIRHGVAGSVGRVAVTVVARREGEVLRLSVLDDGPGFGGATADSRGTGLGLGNTRRRLGELYGDAASLETEDRVPHGAAVTITLPFHTTPQAGQAGP